jgi:glycosyltransferase involved in cell wall biosynthesis
MVLIKAAEILKRDGKPVTIAFSGKENDNRNPGYTEKLKAYVKENNLDDVIYFLGFLDRREQLKLMKNAIAVIQPSLFEGWSTVIEDAMAMNQTVIAGDLDVNYEQLGEMGVFFDRNEPTALANKVQEVLMSKKKVDYNYKKKQLDFAINFSSCLY